MLRVGFALSALLALGCGSAAPPKAPPVAPESPSQVASVTPEAEPDTSELSAESGPLLRPGVPRRAGDRLVYRFERQGSEPLVFTEEVLEKNAERLSLRVLLEDGKKRDGVLVELSPTSERLLSVRNLEGSKALPLQAYGELLERTAFVADDNGGLRSEGQRTCLLGSREAQCTTKTFEVLARGDTLTLAIERSEELGRDVSTEVVDGDGHVLYRAVLVEAVRGAEVPEEKSAQAFRDVSVRESLLERL